MDLGNLDTPIKTTNKVPCKLKHEFWSEVIEGFIGLQPKTDIFKNETSKEKGIKKVYIGKHEDYYNALFFFTKKNCRRL